MFQQLQLSAPITDALAQKGYKSPTPIQQQCIPVVLQGKDLFGCAQTGTGKTAAFALPLLELLSTKQSKPGSGVRALILAPTRELALQINDSFTEYGKNLALKNTVIFGGVSQVNQVKAIKAGVHIITATPGRLIDLIQQKLVHLRDVEYFVLDEADRMLDMGFIHDIKKIITLLPKKRQTLMFSATIPNDIRALSESILQDPVTVHADVVSSSSALVNQSVYHVKKENKRQLLGHVLSDREVEHALVFTRTKRGADKVAKDLAKFGIAAAAIHGNKSQGAREKALKSFRNHDLKVLVATDIASRGIDVAGISHVINFEIPEQAETYVHRIGRTGRAGSSGFAMSFCSDDERTYLRDIQKLIRMNLPVANHPYENNKTEQTWK